MPKPFITLTSDFGVQTQGVGIMEAVARSINPEAHVIHLMHGLPDFDVLYAARTMETLRDVPVGFHVCVVDPGVGTARKPIILQVGRGDYLVGPDNGVFLPAARFLGGIVKAVEITNQKYMRLPVSPIFHGRDIFTPAAAHLSRGVPIEEFGRALSPSELISGPYEEARQQDKNTMDAKVISINKFGSLHLNITHQAFDDFCVSLGSTLTFSLGTTTLQIPFVTTFGDVSRGKPLILKDDYGRVEVALNQGSFAKTYPIRIGEDVVLRKNG